MKRAELEALGIDKEAIDKVMAMNGADIEAKKKEIEGLKADRDKATTALADANEKLKGVEGKDDTIKDLQDQLQKYADAEKERKAKEEDDALTAKIAEVFPEDKVFTSDYVKNGVIRDIKEALAKDKTKGAKEIFESITMDEKGNAIEGIFKNAQHEKIDIDPAGGTGEDDKPAFKTFF